MSESPLQRVAAGDLTAMQACIEQYGGLVWSLARRLFASSADLDDVVQDAFIAIWKSAHRFDQRIGSEVTFVAMVARMKIIDCKRRSERQRRPLHELTDVVEPSVADTTDAPELTEEATRAAAAMRTLPAEQRKALTLAIHYGLTQEQIAAHTGLPLGTVKTHVWRGLQRVRERLRTETARRAMGVSP